MKINLEMLRINRLELGLLLRKSAYVQIFQDKLQKPQLNWQSLPAFEAYRQYRNMIHGIGSLEKLEKSLNIIWTRITKNPDLFNCWIYKKGGNYHILEGHHRLGLAYAKGMRTVEIKDHLHYEEEYFGFDYPDFNFAPSDWEALEDDAFQIYKQKKLYHPVPLPCFSDWALERKSGRVPVIKQACQGAKQILDLGCHIGGLSFEVFQDNRVVGIDNNSHAIRVAKKLTLALNKPVIFFCMDILNFLQKPPHCFSLYYDVILCLSVLHHIRRASENKFKKILPLLAERGSKLILDYAEQGEATIFPQEFRLSTGEIKEIILDNSSYKKAEIIGFDEQFKRHLFLFQ